jgi:hypothetical protein
LRTGAQAAVPLDAGADATAVANALGEQAAGQLRAQGAEAYLAAAPH